MPDKIEIDAADIPKIEALAGYGLTVQQIASVLGMSKKTFERRMREIPGINDALEKGRAVALAKVGQTAYDMATSGQFPVMTIFWMKVRGGWRETREIELSTAPGKPLVLAAESPEERAQRISALTEKLAMMSDGDESTIDEIGALIGTGDTPTLGDSGEGEK